MLKETADLRRYITLECLHTITVSFLESLLRSITNARKGKGVPRQAEVAQGVPGG